MAPTEPAANGSAPFSPARRTVLKTFAAGTAGVAAFPLLAACTGSSKAGKKDTSSKKTSFGSNASDPVPKKGYAAVVTAFQKSSGDTVSTNTKDHNTFQDQISNYLAGSPDDAFTWFAGYRMKYYAKKGLIAPVDDAWDKIGADNFGEGIKTACTADDGKKYLVPNYNYPWAFFYRKSVWEQKGYEVPTTYDALKTLCAKMKADGMIPIQFADKDGWPAMGTFDYINMRLNGYQFHIDLMGHKESWDQQKVKDVFDTWKAILPFQDTAALGLTWQNAAQKIATKKSGMFLLGSFVTQQFTDATVLADVDFFPFPSITESNGQDAVEAPIDGLMLSKKGGGNGAAAALVEFIGTPEGQNAYQAIDKSNIATNKKSDTSGYSELTKKAQQTIANAKYISQFLDRDALPALASNVMIPALQKFIKDGTFDTSNVEKQAKALYAAQ
ncbi:MAG: ABC transporter substrate-binding protein [Jatrophihabitans sp.]